MTIDEAIKHAEDIVEQNTKGLEDAIALGGQNPTQEEIEECEKCAAEHRQLAEWLKELKQYRENRTNGSSTDAVSRKDARHLHCKICRDYFTCYRNPETCEDLKAFDSLPPVTPTVDRISCSDRMPEKDKEVFVYLFDNSPYIAWWDGEKWHTEDFILDEYDEPLEWYELPKPFEPQESEG